MSDCKNKYLPIGTVVLLKHAIKRVMIIGFKTKPNQDNNSESNEDEFDYVGCIYPEGMVKNIPTMLFNHEQISKIYHLGLEDDEEEKEFKDMLMKQNNYNNNDN